MHLPAVSSLLPTLLLRDPKSCRCGHERVSHEHYRSGTDCALCVCRRFRAGVRSAPRPPAGAPSEGSTGESRLVA